ncbi:E1-E2 ATPase family protein, partial [Vibrio parahaemolyticus V-223/04]
QVQWHLRALSQASTLNLVAGFLL